MCIYKKPIVANAYHTTIWCVHERARRLYSEPLLLSVTLQGLEAHRDCLAQRTYNMETVLGEHLLCSVIIWSIPKPAKWWYSL